jgi:hypothetical protein
MSKEVEDQVTVGLSEPAYQHLVSFAEAGVFSKMSDGYRFAVALGLAHDGWDKRDLSRRTIFNVGSLDPDRSIYEAVSALRSLSDEAVYRTAERYAEWGISELVRLRSGGEIDFAALLFEAESMLDDEP